VKLAGGIYNRPLALELNENRYGVGGKGEKR
jgi:hypothetical protein